MDISVTFLALPTIAKEFEQSLSSVTWVALSSSLVITTLLLPMGQVSEFLGRKRFYTVGMSVFTGGAILSALMPTFELLIFARVIMAIGAAMCQAIVMAIVTSVFPNHERGKALGMITTAVSIGGIVGPVFGGPIIAAFSWRVMFILLAIPTGLAVFSGWLILDEEKMNTPPSRNDWKKFDWIGAVISAIALFIFILVIANPFGLPLLSVQMIIGTIAFVVLFILFIIYERKAEIPMLSLSFFSNPTFKWANFTRLSAFTGSAPAFFIMPIFMQIFLGYTPGRTGFIMFLNSLGIGIASQFSGRLSDKVGSKMLCILGILGILCMNIIFIFFDEGINVILLGSLLFTYGVFMGIWMPPNMSLTIGSVERKHYGSVGALVNLVRNVGSVTGQAIFVAVVTGIMVGMLGFEIELAAIGTNAGQNVRDAFILGWQIAFIVLASFIGISLVTAFLTKEIKPNAS